MTPEEDALARTVRLLDSLSIPYMLTGSVASSFHGRPRSTHDADIVIDPAPEQLELLVRRFEENFQGNVTIKLGIPRSVDLANPPLPMAATTSYVPSRVPSLRVTAAT